MESENTPFHLRAAEAADAPEILALYAQARAWFAAHGVDQWQDAYPDAALPEDLARGESYVIEARGRVAATFMTGAGPDAAYARMETGAWRTFGPYAVLHRVAVDEAWKGRGLAGLAVAYACRRFAGMASLRGDTHADNRSMQRMLEKNGFVRCGVIHLADGAPRIAFEKVLSGPEASK